MAVQGIAIDTFLDGRNEYATARAGLVDPDAVVFGPAQNLTMALTLPGEDLFAYQVTLPADHPRTRESFLVYVAQLLEQIEDPLAEEWGADWDSCGILVLGAHYCARNRWRIELGRAEILS